MARYPVPRSSDPIESWEPFAELNRLTRDLARVFDRWPFTVSPDGAFTPAADVEETDDAFILELELPGVRKEDISVEVAGPRVAVRGERKERERRGVLRRKSRVTGTFHYEVTLPGEIDADRIEARLEDGVLTVRVPKAGAERPRRIAVK
jgi:HSP20 family protein